MAMIDRGSAAGDNSALEATMRRVRAGQAEHLQADGTCECGCPSISLVLPENRMPARPDVESQTVLGADCEGGGVLLFVRDGAPSHLERYTWEDAVAEVFPPAAALRFE